MAWEAVVAVYAAGVSTVVAAQQVVRELPSVRVRTMRGASLIQHGQPSETILIVDVVNAGRRRVVIDQVAFTSSDHFLSIPSMWVVEWPFMLGEGELKSLRHPENGTIPDDAIFLARDTVGRWWPRHRRPMIWLRRRKAKGRTVQRSTRPVPVSPKSERPGRRGRVVFDRPAHAGHSSRISSIRTSAMTSSPSGRHLQQFD